MSKGNLLSGYLQSFFEEYLIAMRNLSPNTVKCYRDTFKLLLKYVMEKTEKKCTRLAIEDFTVPLILDFLTNLESRGNSISTRNNRLAAIRVFFEYLSGKEPQFLGHCQKITAIPTKRGSLPSISYLEKEEIEAILNVIDKTTLTGYRDFVMILYMYNSGARVQEVADTTVSWFQLMRPYRVEIIGKGRKRRICPLWHNTGEMIRELISRQDIATKYDAHVFYNRTGKPLTRFGIDYIIKKYASLAANKCPSIARKRVSPHTIRHTTAIHLLQSGVEINVIKSWLGHAQLETTSRYIEIDISTKEKAIEKCAFPAGKENKQGIPSWKTHPDILSWLESL